MENTENIKLIYKTFIYTENPEPQIFQTILFQQYITEYFGISRPRLFTRTSFRYKCSSVAAGSKLEKPKWSMKSYPRKSWLILLKDNRANTAGSWQTQERCRRCVPALKQGIAERIKFFKHQGVQVADIPSDRAATDLKPWQNHLMKTDLEVRCLIFGTFWA